MSHFFWKITTSYLSYVVPVKSTVEILQNFVTFSEYMNFTIPKDRPVQQNSNADSRLKQTDRTDSTENRTGET